MKWRRGSTEFYIESDLGYRVSRHNGYTNADGQIVRDFFLAFGPGRDPDRTLIGAYDSGKRAREACALHAERVGATDGGSTADRSGG